MPPKIGTVDILEASIGLRGQGKSTGQCRRALELCHQFGGAYVIGHSIGARLPESLPDGTKLPIVYHQTIEKLARGLWWNPGKWHILAPTGEGSAGSADAMLRYSLQLSESLRRSAWQRANPFRFWSPTARYTDIECVPIIQIIDEGVAISSASTTRREKDSWFMEYLFSLRHNHIALLYSVQNATARSWMLLEQATAIHCFASHHEWALNAVRAAGGTADQIQRITRLPKYEHVTISWEQSPSPQGRPPIGS